MLTCQLMMAAMSVVKRFDTSLLQLWASFRNLLSGKDSWRAGGEAEY
jgi:hypothetical protein